MITGLVHKIPKIPNNEGVVSTHGELVRSADRYIWYSQYQGDDKSWTIGGDFKWSIKNVNKN